MKSPRRLLVIALLALAGVGIAVKQSQHFYQVRSGTADFKSFCTFGTSFNCEAIAISPYAEFLGGLPLSSFVGGWFLALFIIALIARNRFWRRDGLRALFALTGIGTVFSIIYFVIMVKVLQTYCLLCLFIDGISLASLGMVLSLKPEGFKTHKPEWQKWKVFFAVIIASLLVSVFGLKIFDSFKVPSAEINRVIDEIIKTPPVVVRTDGYPSFGPSNAPVTIVEFSDFKCPMCRIGAQTLHPLLQRYRGKLRIVFRNFPLDSSCNRIVQQPMHPVACEAARTMFCAHKQGKAEEIYQKFFENQAMLNLGGTAEYAAHAGLNMQELNACMNATDTATALSKDIEEGIQLGIQATPTFFINGHMRQGTLPSAVWIKLIDSLLK